MAKRAGNGLEFRVRADQLEDLKAGLYFSLPISTALSALILAVELNAGDRASVLVWFAVVNAINAARIVIARFCPAGPARDASAWLRIYGILALLSGVAWSFIAYLTAGFTAPESTVHLLILAGISAGAVVYGVSYAVSPISFITPPLLITAACLAMKGTVGGSILAFAVLLFLAGLFRGVFLGQARFLETSRLRHEAERGAAEMERISREDPLTGMLNRRGLEHAIDSLNGANGPFVAILIDLDGFKSVNDTYGHKIGDQLLTEISLRIREEAGPETTIARIGGDEFVLLFPSRMDAPDPAELVTRLISRIASPYPGIASVRIGASAGIYRAERLQLTEILLRADIALYTAKHRGRNEFRVFDEELEEELKRRQCIERDLRAAIETGMLGTWFQPIVQIDTGAVVGFEALLRWWHPGLGAISPPEIVAAARQTGMLQFLTEAVFSNCCSMMRRLTEANFRGVRVAMNVSPRELEAGNIDDLVLNGLTARGLPPSMFEIEITEEAPVDPDRVDEKLGRLAHAGISIALDDFGTGFSTLASLKDRRISKVKIDKAFVRDLPKSSEDQLLVKAVIDIGRSLDIEVMAEGVETEAMRSALQSLGCRMAQGYLFSKALPAGQALDLLREGRIRRSNASQLC